MAIPMLKIRRPLGRLIFNMGIAIPGKTVFLIETAPLFRLIQCIHHCAIANNQLNDTVSKSFESKLTDFNRFVKPAWLTAPLAQQIELINSRRLQDVTESLVSHFRERIDAFKRQLSTFLLNVSDSEKAQLWQINGHIRTLGQNWKIKLW